MRIVIPTYILIALTAIVALEANAQKSSTHMITVDRIFSARPRSMSYRYLVKIQCRPAGENIVTVPAKNAPFKWKIGAESGSSVTDNKGMTEFTQTAFDGNLTETMEIEYHNQKLYFSAARGLQEVQVQEDCH